jgi:lipopolysaccharide transport system ATP-binding protein
MGDAAIRMKEFQKVLSELETKFLYGTHDVFRNMFSIPNDTGKLRKSEFWALDDVSFELKKGETLGIMGVNGSGKSTLLRLLSGIFPPDKGRISVYGKIGSLIAVGAGFHPHMTGRENIYLNGTILGITRNEIRKKFDSIVDFAEIGDFLEAPLSTYSSGMRVRLGFAIALHCDPDILLIDEILSVGDLVFGTRVFAIWRNFGKRLRQ